MNLNLSPREVRLLEDEVIPRCPDKEVRNAARFAMSTATEVGGTLTVDFGALTPAIIRAIGAFASSASDDSERELSENLARQLRARLRATR